MDTSKASQARRDPPEVQWEPPSVNREEAWRRRLGELAHELDRVYLVALRIVGAPELAEEAVQESFAKILETPPVFRGPEYNKALAYLIIVVRHTALNMLKSGRASRRRESSRMPLQRLEPEPGEEAARGETAAAARAALGSLPAEQREVVTLCCELNLTQRMAAEILQVPEKTVGNRLARALEALRVKLLARGLAALTPLAIGEALRGVGVPPAPAGLQDLVRALTSETAGSARPAGRAIGNCPGGSKAWLAAGACVAGFAIAAGWLLAWKSPLSDPAGPFYSKELVQAGLLPDAASLWEKIEPRGQIRETEAEQVELFTLEAGGGRSPAVELCSKPILLGGRGLDLFIRMIPNRGCQAEYGIEILDARGALITGIRGRSAPEASGTPHYESLLPAATGMRAVPFAMPHPDRRFAWFLLLSPEGGILAGTNPGRVQDPARALGGEIRIRLYARALGTAPARFAVDPRFGFLRAASWDAAVRRVGQKTGQDQTGLRDAEGG